MNSPLDPSLAVSPDAAAGAGRVWHGVEHYENFPVASRLLPQRLRPAVIALYRFARHADDIADEGDALPGERRARLQTLHAALRLAQAGKGGQEPVVDGLTAHVQRHGLSWRYLHDLLDAFEQDLTVRRYDDAAAVDDYCRRSADPIGRLLLELFGVATAANLGASDAICSALQRVNFLQDIVVDFSKDRIYLPLSTLQACGIDEPRFAEEIRRGSFSMANRRAIAFEARRARQQLLSGRPLVRHVPVRLGWELRFIIAGALRILDRLACIDHDVAAARPRLGWRDAPALLYQVLTLSRQQAERP